MNNELNSYQYYLIVLGYLAQNNLDGNVYIRESLEGLLRLAQCGENPFRDKNCIKCDKNKEELR